MVENKNIVKVIRLISVWDKLSILTLTLINIGSCVETWLLNFRFWNNVYAGAIVEPPFRGETKKPKRYN